MLLTEHAVLALCRECIISIGDLMLRSTSHRRVRQSKVGMRTRPPRSHDCNSKVPCFSVSTLNPIEGVVTMSWPSLRL